MWMPTMERDFFSEAAEVHAAALETPQDAKLFLQGGFKHLSELLETQAILVLLQKFNWREVNEEVMSKAEGYGVESYAKFKAHGFWGAALSEQQEKLKPLGEHDKLIKIFAELIKSSQTHRFQNLQGRL